MIEHLMQLGFNGVDKNTVILQGDGFRYEARPVGKKIKVFMIIGDNLAIQCVYFGVIPSLKFATELVENLGIK